MYDGIFEDLEKVKAALALRGHNKTDENYIFEQLENVKSVDGVVERVLQDSLKYPDSGFLEHLEDGNISRNMSRYKIVDKAYLRRENTGMSSEVQDDISTVDLEEEHPIPQAINLTKSVSEIVDLTEDSPEKKQILMVENEDFLDLTHSESDIELDDYYKTESWGLEGDSYDKIDSPPLLSLFPLRGITSSPNPENHREQTGGQVEFRPEEILEENNNDPNNNLDNIQILEQNRSSASPHESIREQVFPQERSDSPKPGCSKDSSFAPQPSSWKYTDIRDEATKIVELLPRLRYSSVVDTLLNHGNDPNRIERALLELLQKPTPNMPTSTLTKRRQIVDACPSAAKKVCSSPEPYSEQQTASTITAMITDNSDDSNNSSDSLYQNITEILDDKVPMSKIEEDSTVEDVPVIQNVSNNSVSNTMVSEELVPAVKPGTSTELDWTTNTTAAVKQRLSQELSQSTEPASAVKAGTSKEPAVKPTMSEESASAVEPDSLQVSTCAVKLAFSKVSTSTVKPGTSKESDRSSNMYISLLSKQRRDSSKLNKNAKLGVSKKADNRIEASIPRWKTDYRSDQKNDGTGKAAPNNSKGAVPKSSIVRPAKLQLATSTSFQPSGTETKPLLRPARLNIKESKFPTEQPSSKTFSNLSIPTHSQAGQIAQAAAPNVVNTKHYPTLSRSLASGTQASGSVVPTAKASSSVLPATQTSSNAFPTTQASSNVLPTAKASSSVLPATQTSSNVFPTTQASISVQPTTKTSGRPDLKTLDMCLSQLRNSIQTHRDTLYRGPMIDWNNVDVPNKKPKMESFPGTYRENWRKLLNVEPGVASTSSSTAGEVKFENMEMNPKAQIEKESPPREPPRELYNPLRSIFPDVDPTYIANLCLKKQHLGLEPLIDKLLESGDRHRLVINPEPEPFESTVDDQYENLVGIFPNADPMFLRAFAEENYNKPDAIKQFVQEKLERHNYPTKEDYLKKVKITEQQRQYTTEFNVQQFLNIFPDPFGHFENPDRKNHYHFLASEFLKGLFNQIKVATISKVYTRHRYNMSLAAKELEIIRQDMKSRRASNDIPTEDIPFLQEMAFLRNKKIIREYIEKQKAIEQKEFNELKNANQLLECQCCFDNECMPSKCSHCTDGHIFCNTCIIAGTESRIGEGQTQFPCFAECEGEFSLLTLQEVLKPTIFSILLQKRQEAEVMAAGLEGLVSCPFCHFASIPPPEDKIFKCLNPECMKESCRLCKELSHVPLRCDELIKGEEARKYLEEKMTNALVRTCYQCLRPFFKEEGCNKMSCPCGACMCYICGKPVKDYKHFNAQGAERSDLCPLWSDNKRLNAQTVREVAHAAQQEIISKNPNLTIDATALMPTMPAASKGPHDDIPNGNMLPLHVPRPGRRIP